MSGPDLPTADDVESLRQVVGKFLSDRSPEPVVRELMESDLGFDRPLWDDLGRQLGLQGLLVPDEHGGGGGSFVELLAVLEVTGSKLLCAPLLSTAVTVATVLEAGDEALGELLLPRLGDGSRIGALALAEDGAGWVVDGLGTSAERAPDGWRLSGVKDFVVDGHLADTLLVSARADDGPGLFVVDVRASGVSCTQVPSFDLTRRLARVELRGAPATPLGPLDRGRETLLRALDLFAIALAAEQLGGAAECLDQTVRYAKTRSQFGRAIGSFQAVKHACADVLLRVETSRSAVMYAGAAIASGEQDLSTVASVCKAVCSEAYLFAANQNIQIHGGIGFAWEHAAHLHLKRAQSGAMLLGDAAFHQERVAELLAF